jgi:2-phosphosulfolactate phosphatase
LTQTIYAYAKTEIARPEDLAGGLAVVVDVLRASTTICAALGAGAREVAPCLEVAEASALARSLGPAAAVSGGERAGRRVESLSLGNSPGEYTPGAVAGKTVALSTTNGTRALLWSRHAERIFVGALVNVSALCRVLRADGRDVHLICAGVSDRVAMEDCIGAGAIAAQLIERGSQPSEDDQPVMFARLFTAAQLAGRGSLVPTLRTTLGGRNLLAIGLEGDIETCGQVDTLGVVPELDRARSRITNAA